MVGLTNAAHQFKTIHAWHHHISHQHIGACGKEFVQRIIAIERNLDAESLCIKCVAYNHGQVILILGQQYLNCFH